MLGEITSFTLLNVLFKVVLLDLQVYSHFRKKNVTIFGLATMKNKLRQTNSYSF